MHLRGTACLGGGSDGRRVGLVHRVGRRRWGAVRSCTPGGEGSISILAARAGVLHARDCSAGRAHAIAQAPAHLAAPAQRAGRRRRRRRRGDCAGSSRCCMQSSLSTPWWAHAVRRSSARQCRLQGSGVCRAGRRRARPPRGCRQSSRASRGGWAQAAGGASPARTPLSERGRCIGRSAGRSAAPEAACTGANACAARRSKARRIRRRPAAEADRVRQPTPTAMSCGCAVAAQVRRLARHAHLALPHQRSIHHHEGATYAPAAPTATSRPRR